MKKYKFEFSFQGFLAFVLVMLPNIVWKVIPPANQLLQQTNTDYLLLDVLLNVSQCMMIVLLIFCVSRYEQDAYEKSVYLKWSFVFLAGYYICWVLYYLGVATAWLMLGMAFFPAAFLLLWELKMHNYPALIPSLIFAVTHIGITAFSYVGKMI